MTRWWLVAWCYQSLVGLGVIVHGQGLVAAAEADPGVPVHQHDVAQLTRALHSRHQPHIGQPEPHTDSGSQ